MLLNVSVSLENFKKSLKIINSYSNIWYSCGIHPLYCSQEDSYSELESLSQNNKVVAIGETGLDYFRKKDNIDLQKKSFRKHIRVSIKVKKPVIVHTRNSSFDVLDILKEEKAHICKGVIHSFTENISVARKLLNMDMYISFSGIATFNNTYEIQQVVKFVPVEKMLIETDSPYLAPVPYRGKENQPAYLYYLAKHLSKLKKMNLSAFSEITTKNFYTLFLNKTCS